jgi:hypothetical protein
MAYYINKQAPMSGISSLLALRGRQGDSELVHMTKPELMMLQRMGKLTINPRTGLPEAFNLEDAFTGLSSLMNQDMSGREAMQELMNFGRNKIAEYNVDETEMEMPVPAPTMPTQPMQEPMAPDMAMLNEGGLVTLLKGGSQPRSNRYFEGMVDKNGSGDGMSDDVHFKVEGDPKIKNALLSRDEYVIAADVVSALGNGSSDAGAEKLDEFMKDVRRDTTGNPNQQKEIDGDKKLRELT